MTDATARELVTDLIDARHDPSATERAKRELLAYFHHKQREVSALKAALREFSFTTEEP